MRWTDLLCLSLIFGLALAYFFWPREAGSTGRLAQIDFEGRVVMALPLHAGQEERVFSLPGQEQVEFKLYKDGSIAFYHANCPDQICVRTGHLSRVGDFAACVPNRMSIQILQEEGGDQAEAPDQVIG